jgi:hypothetical protein
VGFIVLPREASVYGSQVAGWKPSVSHNIAQQRNPYAAVPYLTRKRMMMKQLEIF